MAKITTEELKHRIDCAMGNIPCETRITNAQLVDVFTGSVIENCGSMLTKGKSLTSAATAKQAPNKPLTLAALT